MKQRLGTRRLMGLITGEYSHITVAGKKMTADNFNAEGKSVFYYDGKRCTVCTNDFDWGKRTVLQDVCNVINKKFGL